MDAFATAYLAMSAEEREVREVIHFSISTMRYQATPNARMTTHCCHAIGED